MKLETWQLRAGRVAPKLCGGSVGLVSFIFGSEKQKIYYCNATTDIVSSDDSALFSSNPDNAFFSARFKAYPYKYCGKIIFDSVVAGIPEMFKETDITDLNNIPSIAPPTQDNPEGGPSDDCFVKGVGSNKPSTLIDLSSLSIELNNQGLATVSFNCLSKLDNFQLPDIKELVSGFSGQVVSIDPSPSNGTDYIEYKITARGIIGNPTGGSPPVV